MPVGQEAARAARLQGALLFRTCPVDRTVKPGREHWGDAGIGSFLPVAGVQDPLWVSMGVVGTRAILQPLAISQTCPLLDIRKGPLPGFPTLASSVVGSRPSFVRLFGAQGIPEAEKAHLSPSLDGWDLANPFLASRLPGPPSN